MSDGDGFGITPPEDEKTVAKMVMSPPAETMDLVQSVFGPRLDLALAYAELLADEGIDWGLVGPRETTRLWERHIVNSVCVIGLIGEGSMVADLGSGAGLPGIPLAIARPDLRIDLVEPMRRRVDFLTLCVDRLGLGTRVRVVRSRAEDYRGRPDVVTCRAVASLTRLIDLVGTGRGRPAPGGLGGPGDSAATRSARGVRRRGALSDHGASPVSSLVPPATLLAIKGERAETEVAAAEKTMSRCGLTADILRPELAGHVLGTVVRVRGDAR